MLTKTSGGGGDTILNGLTQLGHTYTHRNQLRPTVTDKQPVGYTDLHQQCWIEVVTLIMTVAQGHWGGNTNRDMRKISMIYAPIYFTATSQHSGRKSQATWNKGLHSNKIDDENTINQFPWKITRQINDSIMNK